MFNSTSWVKITQHVFCPIFSQYWVSKKKKLGCFSPAFFRVFVIGFILWVSLFWYFTCCLVYELDQQPSRKHNDKTQYNGSMDLWTDGQTDRLTDLITRTKVFNPPPPGRVLHRAPRSVGSALCVIMYIFSCPKWHMCVHNKCMSGQLYGAGGHLQPWQSLGWLLAVLIGQSVQISPNKMEHDFPWQGRWHCPQPACSHYMSA